MRTLYVLFTLLIISIANGFILSFAFPEIGVAQFTIACMVFQYLLIISLPTPTTKLYLVEDGQLHKVSEILGGDKK